MSDRPTMEEWRAELDAMEAAARKRKEAGQRRRLKAHTAAEPIVRALDRSTVVVGLCGTRGRGREMTLDRDVWREVSARLGTRWVIEPRAEGFGLCVCAEGTDPVVPMDDEVIEVPKGLTLVHRNRDITDLRLSNLYSADMVKALSYAANRLPRLPRPDGSATGSEGAQGATKPELPHGAVTNDPAEQLDP